VAQRWQWRDIVDVDVAVAVGMRTVGCCRSGEREEVLGEGKRRREKGGREREKKPWH